MGEEEGVGGGFNIAYGNLGFEPQEHFTFFDTYHQPVLPPGVLCLNDDAGTATPSQGQRQSLQPDSNTLSTEVSSTTQTVPGESLPNGFDSSMSVDAHYADSAYPQTTFIQFNNSSAYMIEPDFAHWPLVDLPSDPNHILTWENNISHSTPTPTDTSCYATPAGTFGTSSTSNTMVSAEIMPESSATSPTASTSTRFERYRCKYRGCKSKHTWATRAELKRHIRYHEKPHRCITPSCERAFTNKSDLRRHLQDRHMTTTYQESGEINRFLCLYAGCKRKYKRNDNMLKHLRKHGEDASQRRQRRGSKG